MPRARTLSEYVARVVTHPAKRRGKYWKRMTPEEWTVAESLKLNGAKFQPRRYEMIRTKVRAL